MPQDNLITFGNGISKAITIPIGRDKIIEIYFHILCYGLNEEKSGLAVLRGLKRFEAIKNLLDFLTMIGEQSSGLLGEGKTFKKQQALAFKIYQHGFKKAFPKDFIDEEVLNGMEQKFSPHHPVMQVMKYLQSVDRIGGMGAIYEDKLLREQFDQTFLSIDERERLTKNQFLVKTLRPEVVDDFWKQISDYSYRPKLRSPSTKQTSHKLSLRKGTVKVNESKKKKEDKKYVRTKKQSATLLSQHLQTPFFNFHGVNVGFLFDLPLCQLKGSMMYDISTFERGWHGSKGEVEAWLEMVRNPPQTQEKTLYYTNEFEQFKERVNDRTNDQMNEVLAEFSENSIRGIFVGYNARLSIPFLPDWHKLGLYRAFLLQYQYYVKFGRELPIYYYCAKQKIFRKLSRYDIGRAYKKEVHGGSLFYDLLRDIIEEKSINIAAHMFNGGGISGKPLIEIFCFSLAFSTLEITKKIFDEMIRNSSKKTIKEFLNFFVMKCLSREESSPSDVLSKYIIFEKNKEVLECLVDKMFELQMWESLSDLMLFMNDPKLLETISKKLTKLTQMNQERKVNEDYWECCLNASMYSLQGFKSALDSRP